jgi:dipeptidyl aminopeptidase/acylaminoacyl peptidase
MKFLKTWLVAAMATWTLASMPAAAAPLSIEDIWKAPQFRGPTLSPNGQYVAVTMAVKERMNLAIVDLATRKASIITNFDNGDVVDVNWVGNERLVFSIGQLNKPVGDLAQLSQGGLFTITREGKEFRVISPTVKQQMDSGQNVLRSWEYDGRVEGSEEEVFARANEVSERSNDLYKVNVRTGKRELLTQGRPDFTQSFIRDRNDVPRVATSFLKNEPVFIISYRDDAKSPWQELTRFNIGSEGMIPMYFDDDNQTLIVASNVGRATTGIFKYDPKKKQLGELLAQHPRFDMGASANGERLPGIIVDPKTRQVAGFAVAGAKYETVWIDPTYAALQKSIDAALPDTINTFRRIPNGNRLLITSYSDRKPGRWYILDQDKKSLEDLFSSRPWLTADKLVPMQTVFYKTRDGQEQMAYLFVPADRKPGERLPMVVHIHGGPWARADMWGTMGFGEREGQLFASRGYAVLVPQFRGTTGLGTKLYTSSVHQMGKNMQNDIEDATDWAIKEGHADAGRVCLSGASYGGYSTLMGLAKTPAKYKCGVAGLAVTDLELIMTSSYGDIPRSEIGLKIWKAMAGDPDKDAAMLREASPVNLAKRMKASILIYAGIDDIRVPLEQMKNMRSALEKEGKSVVWIAKEEEGHGFAKLENNVDLYTQVLDFLDKNIGKGSLKP